MAGPTLDDEGRMNGSLFVIETDGGKPPPRDQPAATGDHRVRPLGDQRAFATVHLDTLAQNVPKDAVTHLIDTAKSVDSSVLNVQLSGNAIETNQRTGQSTSEGLGIIFALFKGRLSKWWAVAYGLAVGIGFLVSPVVQALGVGLFGTHFGWHFAATVLTAHAAFGVALAGLLELRIPSAPFPAAVRNALP